MQVYKKYKDFSRTRDVDWLYQGNDVRKRKRAMKKRKTGYVRTYNKLVTRIDFEDFQNEH